MADTSKTVEIIFGGVDRTGGAVSSVGRNLDSLTNRVGDLTGPLANITDSIVKLDLALAAAAAGVTAYAIKISDDFDTAFGEIATLIGQPADNLRDFQDQILSYSETSTSSLDSITNATYSAISAGVDYRQSLELIAAAEQLSIAGRADLGDTTTALVSTLNAFGASADQAGSFADTFFTTVQLGQTTIPELASSIGRLAPIASAAGLSFEEMAAAIATITAETGTSTPEAITGIRAAITALLKPTAEATKTAASLGIEFSAAALESKGFAGVLAEVAEATGGNTDTIAKLFGSVEALAPVLALTGNASEKFAENLGKFQNNAGAAERASRELTDTLGLLGQTLQNNVNSALIELGSNLTDETRSIVESVTSIFNSLGNEISLDDGSFAPIIQGLEGLAQTIDKKLQAIAENFPEALSGIDLSDLLTAFGDLGDELGDLFSGLFGDVDLSTVEGLQEVLQKVVDAFTALVNVSAGIANGLEPLFVALGSGIEKFQELDEETKKTIGEVLGLGKAINTVLPVIGGLAGGLESVGTGLTALAGAQGFKAVLSNLDSVKSIAAGAGRFGFIGAALVGAGAAGFGLGTLINENIIQPIEEALGTSLGSEIYDLLNPEEFAEAGVEVAKLKKETADLREITQRYEEMSNILGQTMGYTTEITEEQRQAINKNTAEMIEARQKTEEFSGSQRGVTDAISELNKNVGDSGGALTEVSDSTKKLAENNKTLALGYDEASGKVNSWSGTIVKSNKSLDEAAEKTKEVFEETDKYKELLLQIQSDERIANIEANIKIETEQLQADADKAIAIIETLGTSVKSTGDLIGDLFGKATEASGLDEIKIREQIRKENKLREETFESQKRLTDAQVDLIRERTRAISNGDGLMRISLDETISPALELVLREILDKTRVWASEDAQNFLLGVG